MIEVRNITKTFDGFDALSGCSLAVQPGSVYGLVGPNGAGKSTLIRCLTGVYKPDSGQILIDNEPVWENAPLKSRIAYIPDDLYYFMSASTREMMAFYKGLYPKFDVERYEKLKEVFSSIDEKAPIRRLSKGMQKQSAFWLAMCQCPDYVILDEPVDGLDPVMRRQVWSILMSEVAERGISVLVSSHNLRELEDVCDHVGIMSHGQLLIQRSLLELQDSITKVQLVFNNITQLPKELEVLHTSQSGRITTIIVRGNSAEVLGRLAAIDPLLADALPLTLEEIFIYELGGEDYHVKDIIL